MISERFDYRFALLGKGISRSLSPRLHTAIGKSLGLTVEYRLLDVDSDGLASVLDDLRSHRWDGLNVTAPYKVEVARRVDRLHALASQVSAVNTVGCADGQLWGDNTDGVGFADLIGDLSPQRVLVLGAGGVARVVLSSLDRMKSPSIVIANRTKKRAVQLAQDSPSIEVASFQVARERILEFDLVINCLPGGARDHLDGHMFRGLDSDAWFIDLAYGQSAQSFRTRYIPSHLRYRDGLDMLFAQGIRSFELWTGRTPDRKRVRSLFSGGALDEHHN